jgi:RsiW-degrading membrane proteinase PrsW (M82 family)
MTRVTDAIPQPPKWGVAIACILLPILTSFGWLFFVRQFDRARPEPLWLVFTTFLLGCLSCVIAVLAERGLQLTPYLNPQLMTYGEQIFAFPLALVVFTFTVGLSEEGSKFLGAWSLARHRREFDEPVDGIVYGCSSALGFAAVENIKYFAANRLSGLVVTGRAFTSVPLHMFVGAIWGYALGRKLVRKKTSVFLFFLLAAAAHGLFDTLLSFPQTGTMAMLLLIGLGILFAWLLRSALRHGTVKAKGEVPESRNRAYFRMGSPMQFTAWVIALVILAAAIMFIGEIYEMQHRRLTIPFLAISGTLLALFGAAAYGVATSIPLDAAVDPVGITFAGAASEWASIVGVEKYYSRGFFGHRGWLNLRTSTGVVRLGPAGPNVIEQLAALVQSYLGIVKPSTNANANANGTANASDVSPRPDATQVSAQR